jgi:CelD/BcsL family acetyltransferase involved in cellulose biosynthesis
MRIEISIGLEAQKLIEDAEFSGSWRRLYDTCPWGSVFQSEDFVGAWYDTYRERFDPVVVTGFDAEGKMVGLFTLATDTKTGGIVAAGGAQAEYHAWLAEPQAANDFIEAALDKLSAAFPNRSLRLLFLLPNAPIEWARSGRWGKRCYLKMMPRGLMELGDGSRVKDTLRKKKQSKINRLKRLGDLRLERIHDPDELGAVLDEIIPYQALRLRAVHNLSEIQDDPLKRTFHVNLMRLPRMLHATALRVGDKLVSAQIHFYNREQALLWLITHSPFYARYSPGELHTLMLGAELAEENIRVFDLTPGGYYKDRYATNYDRVFVVIVFFYRAGLIRHKLERRLAEASKSAIRVFNLTPDQTKEAFSAFLDEWRKWSRLRPAGLLLEIFRIFKRSLSRGDDLHIYACALDQKSQEWYGLESVRSMNWDGPAEVCGASRPMKRNHIPDLLAYQPTEGWQPPVNKFMRRSLEDLQAGHHVYTRVEGDRLTQYCWLIESQKSQAPDEQYPFLSPDSVMITDFYTYSQGRSLPRSSLRQILVDAANTLGAKRAYIAIPAGDGLMRQVIEEAGFAYQC